MSGGSVSNNDLELGWCQSSTMHICIWENPWGGGNLISSPRDGNMHWYKRHALTKDLFEQFQDCAFFFYEYCYSSSTIIYQLGGWLWAQRERRNNMMIWNPHNLLICRLMHHDIEILPCIILLHFGFLIKWIIFNLSIVHNLPSLSIIIC